MHSKIIVVDDFIVFSAAWGEWVSSTIGDGLIAFIDTLGLVVANNGSKLTFVGKDMGSVVDVTLILESLVSSVQGWKVKIETNNGSDHQSIRFHISPHQQ